MEEQLKPPAFAGRRGVRRQKLHGDRPVQLRVERPVDDTHAAFADHRFDQGRPDRRAARDLPHWSESRLPQPAPISRRVTHPEAYKGDAPREPR